jgi:hypothetical protein
MKLKIFILSTIAFLSIGIIGCSDDGDSSDEETAIGITGVISEQGDGSIVIEDAQVTIIDESTQLPAVAPLETDESGIYYSELPQGTYQVRVTAQGYDPVPAIGMAGIPIVVGDTMVTSSIALTKSIVQNAGWVEGELTDFDDTIGALITLEGNSMIITTNTANDGDFIIHNVPAGSYIISAQLAGYSKVVDTIEVVESMETEVSLSLITETGYVVSGTISFLATDNGEVDVSLVDSSSEVVVPGLQSVTTGGAFSISNVPVGTYLLRATYEIDSIVVDPDWIIKNGEPYITVTNANVTQDLSVTGAVILMAPAIDSAGGTPKVVTSLTPTFEWTPYSSSSDYVIEVRDIDGNILWGGISKPEALFVKNIVIPSSQTSIIYNSDSKAVALVNGETYRWKIFASKNDTKEPEGWKLISSSEEAQGVFTVQQVEQ